MKKLTILVANNHLENYGGSETFTYSFIQELLRKNHNVEYFTFDKGLTSDKIEIDLNVRFMSQYRYDIIFANHTTTVNYLRSKLSYKNVIIQTCHGIYPEIEQPSYSANAHISISQEVQTHLIKLGFKNKLVLNGINCNRFKPTKPINSKLINILSLCHSEQANNDIKKACDELGLNFDYLNKHENQVWNVELKINSADLVIGLGRSAYEAMACGRPVLIYDNRPYSESYADGYLTIELLKKVIINNCSGRFSKKKLLPKDLIQEFSKYCPETGVELRDFALKNLNIEIQVNKYLEFALKTSTNSLNQLLLKYKALINRTYLMKGVRKVKKHYIMN